MKRDEKQIQRYEYHKLNVKFSIRVYPNQFDEKKLPDFCVLGVENEDVNWREYISFDRDFDNSDNEEGMFWNRFQHIMKELIRLKLLSKVNKEATDVQVEEE